LKATRSDGGLPDRVRFTIFWKVSTPDEQGFFDYRVVALTKEICRPDWLHPTWLEHPGLGRGVDIAALDVTADLNAHGIVVDHVNALETDAVGLSPYVSQEVFVVGYPIGLVSEAPIPVWKRGTIATDPGFDPDGRPIVFVDTATRSGMSGSVVFARRQWYGPYTRANGSTADMFMSTIDRILGVYSGRLGPHDVEAQLGIVWKRHLIDEVVNGATVATV
jgi:hypothetical protein